MSPPDLDAPLSPDPEVLTALRRSRPRPWLRWGLGLGLLLGVGAVIAWAVAPGAAPTWETAAVTQGALIERVTAVGQLEPVDSVEVGSDLSGKVLRVAVQANDPVAAGAVLAELEPRPFQNAVTQAHASLAVAQAALAQAKVSAEKARLEVERDQRLAERGAVTSVELQTATLALDTARASVRSAEASVAQARAVLQNAKDDLDKTVIVSPIDGVVTRRLVDPGQTVVSAMSATALFEVASDLHQLKAEVGIDEADVGRVAAGQPAVFTVSAWPERRFDAAVRTVDLAPDDSESVVTYDADLRLANADLALRPGMTATAEIEVGRLPDALQVPSGALRFRPADTPVGEGEWVFVLDNDQPRAVQVQVLGSDGLQTAVSAADLKAGDRVILSGEVTPRGPMGGHP